MRLESLRRTPFCPTSQKSPRVPAGGGQYTVWSSALSDLDIGQTLTVYPTGSQCTFWCSALSDSTPKTRPRWPITRLNAPSGAQCLPTHRDGVEKSPHRRSQCTFWCSALSDTSKQVCRLWPFAAGLNAPSGAQCFPTLRRKPNRAGLRRVSMHLLVLSAFRLWWRDIRVISFQGLNAPSGAQCFPTVKETLPCAGLESQCTFWCSVLSDIERMIR